MMVKSRRNLSTNATREGEALDAHPDSNADVHDEHTTNHPATVAGLPDTGERPGADA
jgi:hypothetical protein